MIHYDPHCWTSHLFSLEGSPVRVTGGRMAAFAAWSVVVVAFHRFVYPVGVPSSVHTLLGVALGLLLVLRTNASYDRFREGRKLWGAIVNECRNLARGARALLSDDPELLRAVVRWTVAFAYSSMAHLRGRCELGPIASRLPLAEVDRAMAAQHTPLEVATRITSLLVEARDRGRISDYLLAMLDQNVQQLIDYLGGCERIRKTPIPFAYMVHLRRALILYCGSLPFAFVGEFGWKTVLVTLGISYVFLGIEEIGVEIEDPFGEDANDLPLEAICNTIETNLSTLIGDVGPQPVAAP